MKFRGLALALGVTSVTSLVACNNSHLVAGATCNPDATAAPVSNSSGPAVHTPPTRLQAPHYVSSANASTSQATAADLLTAMDTDPAGFSNLTISGDPKQYAVFNSLGTVLPSAGSSFAWLTSGIAGTGTPSTLDPSASTTEPGTDMSGPACSADPNSHDCTTLSFSFVVPDGLHSVAFDFNFMSVEYPEFVGLGYNDSFVVSLNSPSHNFTNVVFDHNNNPINIDSVLFTEPCQQLTGTGYGYDSLPGYDPTYNNCDSGATGLLTTTAPVEPGETVSMTFSVFDSGDGIYDSAVMLDNLRVSPEPVGTPNTGTPTPPEPTPTPDACPA